MSKQDRLERLRRLESLRRIQADMARGDSQGLAEVKEEGRQIVEAREQQLAAEAEVRDAESVVEPEAEVANAVSEFPKPKKKRGGGSDDVV